VGVVSALGIEHQDYPIGLQSSPIGLCENYRSIETTKVSQPFETYLMKWRSLEQTQPGTDLRPLGEILAERKGSIAKYVRAETQALHEQAVAELRARGIAASASAVGAKAAPFEVQDHDGKVVRSYDLLNCGRLVICFIRGRWCPFCVGQMEAMNRILPEIEQAGASLVAISPQTVKQSFFMHDQHKLRFPLLSDGGNKVARQFGLVYRVSAKQESVFRKAFVNLPFTNGDDSWELPIPATFVLDRDGTIRSRSANEDYTERPEPADIVAALRSTK
jgi:peroxiredoxin